MPARPRASSHPSRSASWLGLTRRYAPGATVPAGGGGGTGGCPGAQVREPAPLLGRVLARLERMILHVDDVVVRDAGALEHRPCRLVGVAEPRGSGTARAQTAHHALLIGRQPIRRLAAAHAEDLSHARLPFEQRLAPRPRGHDVDGLTEARVQRANQRGDQHHVAERAASDDERSRAGAAGFGHATQTLGTGSRRWAMPSCTLRQLPN